ncbi:MAG TPA: prephenate dehydrogenase/arogenate dehydrogenase family protein [Gemmatirosa sp.]
MAERVVGIVGLGLIGGSLARALVARGVRVLGTARDADDRCLAARGGIEVVDGVAELAAAIPAGGAVVLAVPLPALAAVADALLPQVAPGAIVLHAAGLQRAAATALDAAAQARVIGTHPLAGSHEAGFAASRADLFTGARVWAESRADRAVRAGLEWLWAVAGACAVEYRTAEAHDAAMASLSHLPQLASTALAAALAAAGLPATLGGPGLRDATRLAASPLALWQDVLRAAPPETDAALARLSSTITELRAALAHGDADALGAIWARAAAWRAGPQRAEAGEDPAPAVVAAGAARW